MLAHFYRCNIIILDAEAGKWAFLEETFDRDILYIDVWWWDDATSRLMLLLAYLITRHEKWSKAKIRLLAAGFSKESHRTIKGLEDMLKEVRIEALPKIVEDVSIDKISEYSADSSIVFLPFRIKKNQVVDPLGNRMENTLCLLPVVAMVLAAEDIELDAEPDDGTDSEMAADINEPENVKKKKI